MPLALHVIVGGDQQSLSPATMMPEHLLTGLKGLGHTEEISAAGPFMVLADSTNPRRALRSTIPDNVVY